MLRSLIASACLMLAPTVAAAQGDGLFDEATGKLAAIGWAGFTDYQSMVTVIGSLVLAIVLGAVIGFHPTTPRTVDTVAEADMPKVFVMYAFVGAVVGIAVLEFGMVVGFVVFGLGGLMRFRTDTESTRDTGRLIAVTLIGLMAGLGLPHFAVITSVLAFVLIHLFDSHPTCRVKVDQTPEGRLADAAAAYRAVLVQQGCRIISERKANKAEGINFILRLPRASSLDKVQAAFGEIPAEVSGRVTWQVE